MSQVPQPCGLHFRHIMCSVCHAYMTWPFREVRGWHGGEGQAGRRVPYIPFFGSPGPPSVNRELYPEPLSNPYCLWWDFIMIFDTQIPILRLPTPSSPHDCCCLTWPWFHSYPTSCIRSIKQSFPWTIWVQSGNLPISKRVENSKALISLASISQCSIPSILGCGSGKHSYQNHCLLAAQETRESPAWFQKASR